MTTEEVIAPPVRIRARMCPNSVSCLHIDGAKSRRLESDADAGYRIRKRTWRHFDEAQTD
jgi:hypothetical protein